MGDVPDVTAAVCAALAGEGHLVRRVSQGETVSRQGADGFTADLTSAEQVAQLHRLVQGGEQRIVGAAINLLGLCSPWQAAGLPAEKDVLRICHSAFNLAKELADDLRASAAEGGGCFLNVTGLGGRFGLDSTAPLPIAAAGTLGITKTLGREYPKLLVKNVDVDASQAAPLLASQLIEELTVDDGLLEVGRSGGRRWQIELAPQPPAVHLRPLDLDRQSVIVVTGGAYGVTAEVSKALARAAQPRLVLVGRSELPGAEPAELAGLDGPPLRAKLIERARTRGKVAPAEIEREFSRVRKDRQIRAAVDACRRAGAEVEYHALDVRNAAQFGGLIDDLYARYGRIDGVIHGAGVIEDKRIVDKTLDSFDRVFCTKVDSALTLVRKLRSESLKFLVFFSSVSGRFGNAGQADYSAANEFLNKLADFLDRQWPGRTVAVNWGPWDGGMVSDELRRMYAAAGIDLIPVDEGVAWLLTQLREPSQPSAEVVVSGGVQQMLRGGREPLAVQHS